VGWKKDGGGTEEGCRQDGGGNIDWMEAGWRREPRGVEMGCRWDEGRMEEGSRWDGSGTEEGGRWDGGGMLAGLNHRIIESLRLEETSKVIKSNHLTNTTMPAKPCPEVPHLHIF